MVGGCKVCYKCLYKSSVQVFSSNLKFKFLSNSLTPNNVGRNILI